MPERNVIVVIPARMGALRFPGKPLAKVLGLPMVEHVRRRAILSRAVNATYVATSDSQIKEAVENYGGVAIMTAESHKNAPSRIADAVSQLSLNDDDIVLSVPSNQPLVSPELINALAAAMLEDDKLQCANVLTIVTDSHDMHDKEVVKAVINLKGQVMCYSRSPLPFQRAKNYSSLYRQTGIAAFRRSFLAKFVELAPTPLEITESIDFMRILEHGYSIKGVVFPGKILSVDQKEHVALVEEVLHKDYDHNRIYQAILNT